MAHLSLFTYPALSEGQVGVYRHSGLTLNPCQSELELSFSPQLRSWTQRRARAYLGLTEQRQQQTGQRDGELLTLSVLPPRGSHAAVGISGRLEGLTQDLQQLQEDERHLDHLIHICTTQLRLLSEDTDSQRYPWTSWREGLGGLGPLPGGTREAASGLNSGEGSL